MISHLAWFVMLCNLVISMPTFTIDAVWGEIADHFDDLELQTKLSRGVTAVKTNDGATAAILGGSGDIVAWGAPESGGRPFVRVEEIVSTLVAFAAKKTDGSVVTWGHSSYGGDSSSVSSELSGGVETIFASVAAFAAKKKDGSVVVWGNADYGGDPPFVVRSELSGGVDSVVSSDRAFAALKSDGSVVVWGNSLYGGDSSSVSSELNGGVEAIFSTERAFAALKADGSVISWGLNTYGGDSSAMSSELSEGVEKIFSTDRAFAALKSNGSVVTWGNIGYGGDSSSVSSDLNGGVTSIFSTERAFAALKGDGSVICWGHEGYGGDSSSVSSELSGAVEAIFSNLGAFAALKVDGSVITWGISGFGGSSSSVSSELDGGVKTICSTLGAFAALKTNGSVVTWGSTQYGSDSSSVSSELSGGVEAIFSTSGAFAARKDDGSVVVWGGSTSGGDSSSVSEELGGGVETVFSHSRAFAALKTDGTVVAWGKDGGPAPSSVSVVVFREGVQGAYVLSATSHAFAALDFHGAVHTWGRWSMGGDSSMVAHAINSSVENLFSTNCAFAALKYDGHVITWGEDDCGGDSQAVASSLSGGIATVYSSDRAFAAVNESGMVTTWGSAAHGGDSSSARGHLNQGVVSIVATCCAFAATLRDGSTVVAWGDSDFGGGGGATDVCVVVPNRYAFAALLETGSISAWGSSANGGIAPPSASDIYVDIIASDSAFAALSDSGSVVVWGNEEAGGQVADMSLLESIESIRSTSKSFAALGVNGTLSAWGDRVPNHFDFNPASTIFSTDRAFAAITEDGGVISWGNAEYGGSSSSVSTDLGGGVEMIFSTSYAFAALKNDGSVVTWGRSLNGGDSSLVSSDLSGGVETIFSTEYAFAALKTDGSVICWGNPTYGGDASSVSSDLSGGVETMFSTDYSFAALNTNGSVVTWGSSTHGGDSSSVSSDLSGGVEAIFSTVSAFAALKTDGSVVCWGSSTHGGDSSSVSSDLSGGVEMIFSTGSAFAALKTDGSVVTWGSGGGDSSSVLSELSGGVVTIFSTWAAFAALKTDGSVICWGSSTSGGDSSSVSSELSEGVVTIFSTERAFAALKSDGSVVAWGSSAFGGDSSSLSSDLSGGVVTIYSSLWAFAALKTDGSVVCWGSSTHGGDSSSVSSDLSGGVETVFSTDRAFAALKDDGRVVLWGDLEYGAQILVPVRQDVHHVVPSSTSFAIFSDSGVDVAGGGISETPSWTRPNSLATTPTMLPHHDGFLALRLLPGRDEFSIYETEQNPCDSSCSIDNLQTVSKADVVGENPILLSISLAVADASNVQFDGVSIGSSPCLWLSPTNNSWPPDAASTPSMAGLSCDGLILVSNTSNPDAPFLHLSGGFVSYTVLTEMDVVLPDGTYSRAPANSVRHATPSSATILEVDVANPSSSLEPTLVSISESELPPLTPTDISFSTLDLLARSIEDVQSQIVVNESVFAFVYGVTQTATTQPGPQGSLWVSSFLSTVTVCSSGVSSLRIRAVSLGTALRTSSLQLNIAKPTISRVSTANDELLNPLGGTKITVDGSGFGHANFSNPSDPILEQCADAWQASNRTLVSPASFASREGADLGPSKVVFWIYVGGSPCLEARFESATSLSCVAPPGVGSDLSVTLVLDGLVVTHDAQLSYRAVSAVSAVSPESLLQQSGSDTLSITADIIRFFDFWSMTLSSVRVGPFEVVDITSASYDIDTGVMSILSPPGVGAELPISVCVRFSPWNDTLIGRELQTLAPSRHDAVVQCSESDGAATVSYAVPVIADIVPSEKLSPRGNQLVRLLGTSFGDPDLMLFGNFSVRVTISGNPDCRNVQHISSTEITCITPELAGTVVSFAVQFAGAESKPVPVSVVSVSILAVEPSVVVPAAVGRNSYDFTVTAVGADVVASASIGGEECKNLELANAQQFRCLGVAAPLEWSSTVIEVFTNDSTDLPISTRSILQPLPNARFVAMEAVMGIPTTGGVPISLFGQGLGASKSDLLALVFGNNSVILSQLLAGNVPSGSSHVSSTTTVVIDASDPGLTWQSSSQLSLDALPPGVGSDVLVHVVSKYGLASDPFRFSYDSPVIETIEPAILLPGVKGQNITICGKNLAVTVEDVEFVSVGGVMCLSNSLKVKSMGSCIECRIDSPGVGQTWPKQTFRVDIGGQSTGEVVLDGVFLVDAPEVSLVTPSTAGPGDTLTIRGAGFGASLADISAVYVGDVECSRIVRVSSSQVTCVIPSNHPLWSNSSSNMGAVPFISVEVVLTSGIKSDTSTAGSAIVPSGINTPPGPLVTPTGLFAWRPIGQDGTLVVRWRYPDEVVEQSLNEATLEGTFVAFVDSFDVQVSGDRSFLDEEQVVTVGAARVAARARPAERGATSHLDPEAYEWFETRIPVFEKGPLFVRVRATNDDGDGEWVYLSRSWQGDLDGATPATCTESQYLSTNEENLADIQCVACPEGATCVGLSAENVTARNGYWRVPWSQNGLGFAVCSVQDACLGADAAFSRPPTQTASDATPTKNATSIHDLVEKWWEMDVNTRPVALADAYLSPEGTEQCARGRQGVLCGTCSPGYYPQAGIGACAPCGDPGWIAGRFVLLLTLILTCLALILIRAWIKRSTSSSHEVQIAKIVVSHLQSIAIVGSVQLQWPPGAQGFFSVADSASSFSTSGLSMECLLGEGSTSPFSRTALIITMPIWLVVFAALLWAVVGYIERTYPDFIEYLESVSTPKTSSSPIAESDNRVRRSTISTAFSWSDRTKNIFRERMLVSAIVIAFLVHTPLSTAAFRLLTCRPIAPEGDSSSSQLRLAMNLDVLCTDPEQLGAMLGLAVPILVLVSLGVPLGAAYFLNRIGKQRLQRPEWRGKVGFLVNGYKPNLFFWESAVLLRKVLLAFVTTTLAPSGPGMQVTTACLVMSFAVVLHTRFHPYVNDSVNLLETFALVSATITLIGGQYVVLQSLSTSPLPAVSTIASVIIAGVNSVFFFFALILLSRRAHSTFLRWYEAVVQFTGLSCCSLRRHSETTAPRVSNAASLPPPRFRRGTFVNLSRKPLETSGPLKSESSFVQQNPLL